MNIQYKPQSDVAGAKAHTNIGEFWPDEIKAVGSDQEHEAQKLIDNGDFIETDEEPNTDEAAAAAMQAQSDADESSEEATSSSGGVIKRTAKKAGRKVSRRK